jgi:hypothetical protein
MGVMNGSPTPDTQERWMAAITVQCSSPNATNATKGKVDKEMSSDFERMLDETTKGSGKPRYLNGRKGALIPEYTNCNWQQLITVLSTDVAIWQGHMFEPMPGQQPRRDREGKPQLRDRAQFAVCAASPRRPNPHMALVDEQIPDCRKIMLPNGQSLHDLGPVKDRFHGIEQWQFGLPVYSHTAGMFVALVCSNTKDHSLWKQIGQAIRQRPEPPTTYAIRILPVRNPEDGNRKGYACQCEALPGPLPNLNDPACPDNLREQYMDALRNAAPFQTPEEIVHSLGIEQFNPWCPPATMPQAGGYAAVPAPAPQPQFAAPTPQYAQAPSPMYPQVAPPVQLPTEPGAVGAIDDPWATQGPDPFAPTPGFDFEQRGGTQANRLPPADAAM